MYHRMWDKTNCFIKVGFKGKLLTMSIVSRERYAHGHHSSVLKSHTWRTAKNSASYLLPFVRTGASVLDVGCGPGTITEDFADLVGDEGYVIGVDREAGIICTVGKGRII